MLELMHVRTETREMNSTSNRQDSRPVVSRDELSHESLAEPA